MEWFHRITPRLLFIAIIVYAAGLVLIAINSISP